MVCDEVSEQDKLLPPSKTGGLTAIRSAVSSDNRVLRDVAAGTSIRTALEQVCVCQIVMRGTINSSC